MTRELSVLASGGAYFEAPRWHDGMWWTSDLYRKAIFTYSVEGREDKVLDEIPAPPGQNIFACMLSGADRRTLLLCVAPGLASNDRLSGLDATLQTTRVNVPGAGKP